jgi:hypothetical protein
MQPVDFLPRKAGWCRLMLAGGLMCTLLPPVALAGKPIEVAQKIELKSGKLPGLPSSPHGGWVGKLGNSLVVAAAPQTPRDEGALSIWTCPLSSEAGRAGVGGFRAMGAALDRGGWHAGSKSGIQRVVAGRG